MPPVRCMLTPHPQTPSQFVRGVDACVDKACGGALALAFSLCGNLGRLRIANPGALRKADRLWEHTCFEAFAGVKGAASYYEFNFAPSREWVAYRFDAYREGKSPLDLPCDPKIEVRTASDCIELDAVISLPFAHPQLTLALSAVIEDESGALSYWALKHVPGKPDFHHRDAFALEL
jgi:hypothetical protein